MAVRDGSVWRRSCGWKRLFLPQLKSQPEDTDGDWHDSSCNYSTWSSYRPDWREGGQARLPSRVKALSSQTRRFNYFGEASASAGSVTALLRLPTYSECLLAVTADKPTRSFLLWGREQRLLQRPTVGSSHWRWELPSYCIKAGGYLAVTSQGWEPLWNPVCSLFLDWLRSLQGAG